MKYTTNIHKRKLYIKPRPKENIKDGLVLMLNRPISEKGEPFMARDVVAYQKEYYLPDLPEGIWIRDSFVKEEIKL